MKRLIALEEFGQMLLSFFCVYYVNAGMGWLWLIFIFFIPDMGALGYLFNRTVGAIVYNFLHHKFLAVAIILYRYFIQHQIILTVGLLFYGHSNFDRMLGYGLKSRDNPNKTHLGYIGKEKFKNEVDVM